MKGGSTASPGVGLADGSGDLGPVPVLQVAVVLLRNVPSVHCTTGVKKERVSSVWTKLISYEIAI